MFLSTESYPQAHQILGIVNATSHLAMPSNAIDSFESYDQLFVDVQEKLKVRASQKGADGVVDIHFTTDIANMQVAPKFLVLTAYGTMIKLVK